MKRLRKIVLRSLAGLVIGVVLLFAALQTGPGQRLLFDFAGEMASTAHQRIVLSQPSGFFPTNLKLGRIAIADREGVWLTAENAHLDWAVGALFNRHLRISELVAERIDIERLPIPAPPDDGKAPPPPPESGSANDLPIPVVVERLAVTDLRLGKWVGGVTSTWRVGGNALLAGLGGANRLELSASRTDGPADELNITLNFDRGRDVLDGEVRIEEGKGGLATTFLERPDVGVFSTRLTFSGGLAKGRADFQVAAAGAVTSSGNAQWTRTGNNTQLTLYLAGDGRGLPDSGVARLVQSPVKVTGEATIEPGAVIVRSLRLEGGPGHIELSGRYLGEGRVVEGQFLVEAASSRLFELLLPGVQWQGGRASGRIDGSLAALRLRMDATIASLSLREGPISGEDIRLSLDATGEQLPGRPTLGVQLSLKAASIVLPPVQGKAVPATPVELAFKGARRSDGGITVESIDLQTSLLRLTGKGSVAPGAVDGDADFVLTVPDLVPFSIFAGQPLRGRSRFELGLRTADANTAAASWRLTLEDAVLPYVPPGVLLPNLTLTGTGTLDRELRWALQSTRASSDAFALELSGRGNRQGGDLAFTLTDAKLATVMADAQGIVSARGSLQVAGEAARTQIEAVLSGFSLHGTEARRLTLNLAATRSGEAVETQVRAEGDLAGQPLSLSGNAARAADGSIAVPRVDASWASVRAEFRELAIAPGSANGRGHIAVGKLEDLAPFVGTPLAGALEIDAETDPSVSDGKLVLKLRGRQIASGSIAIGEITGEAALVDPLGRGEVQAQASLKGMKGVGDLHQLDAKVSGNRTALSVTGDAAGGTTGVSTAARIVPGDSETVIELSRLELRYAGQRASLAAPTQVRLAGARVGIEPANLALGGGRVRIGGVVDPAATDLAIELAGLPLALLASLAPDVVVEGTLDGKVQISGPIGAPRATANYSARGVRLRRTETALLPAATLTGTASLDGQRAAFDARLSAGAANELALKGTATLPSGNAALSAQVGINGGIDLAVLTPLAGPDVRGLAGKLRTDMTVTVNGARVSGNGTIRLSDAGLALPAQGLKLERGQGTVSLAGETLTIERIVFQTPSRGELALSGTVQFDPAMSLPVQLKLAARNALLANRPDLLVVVSSDLNLGGSVAQGLALDGKITIDKAEVSVAGGRGAAYPTVPVREKNLPPGQAPIGGPRAAASSGGQAAKPIRLNVTVDAPRAIFVRGRGLDAEVGGNFSVTGDSNKPIVVGGMSLRRGTFNLVGHPLKFERGIVSLVSADKLEPSLDFLATSRSGDTQIEVAITGTPAQPKIALSSRPPLPADEIMSLLLFGKATTSLSPFELAQVVQSLAELTGTVSSGGMLDNVRRGMGLDRLGVSSERAPGQKPGDPVSPSVEAGRYVSPGIYVGARQGAGSASSRGVVEIEVLKNTKIEADIGADSRGRVGVKMEWDY